METFDDDNSYSEKASTWTLSCHILNLKFRLFLQLIIVQQNLRSMPTEIVQRYADFTEHLDLSYNCLKDLSWLVEFEQLRYLVLDSNRMHESQLRTLTLPLPQLEVLMFNKNEVSIEFMHCYRIFHSQFLLQFSDLTSTIKLIKRLFPNLQYLSLHGNPICPDGLNLQPFSTYLQYDYEYYRFDSKS